MRALNTALELAISNIDGAELPPTFEVDELAHSIMLLKDLKKVCGMAQAVVEAEILTLASSDEMVSDRYSVSIRDAKVVRTDWSRLLPAALEAIDDKRERNIETGEIESLERTIARLLPTLVPMTQSVGAKKTGAAGLDIELDVFTTSDETKRRVSVKSITQDSALDRRHDERERGAA